MKNEDGRMKEQGTRGEGKETADAVREVGTGPVDQLRLISRTIDRIGNINKMSILYWLYDEDAGRIDNYVTVKKEGEAIDDAVVRSLNEYSTGLVDLLVSWMQTLRKVGITDVMIDERLRLICEIAKDRVKQDVREGEKGPENSTVRCEFCSRYNAEKMFCRKEQRIVSPVWSRPGCFEIRLADHYVENPWSEWKKQAEREALRKKVGAGR